jgi:hypothetical protein
MSRRAALLALVVAVSFPTSGCAVMMLGEGHEGGSGSLSQAAAAAARDSTQRTKESPPDVGETVPPALEPVVVEPGPASDLARDGEDGALPEGALIHHPSAQPYRLFAGLVAGGGALGGRDYDGFGNVGLSFGGYPQPRLRVEGTGTLGGLSFTNQSFLGQAFKDPVEANLDVTVRYYLTPDRTFMGLYPLAGLGTGTLFWDYAHPVTVIENGRTRTLDGDRINYFSVFGGAGVSLVQTRFVHVGGNLAGGARFYGWHTESGLKNDMLRTTGYVKAAIELTFRVK